MIYILTRYRYIKDFKNWSTCQNIAPDKKGYPLQIRRGIFLISRESIVLYSLEAPLQGSSNEYPQHGFVEK